MTKTRRRVYNIRNAGMHNMGILLDMGHIPIMHETPESAVTIDGELLEHIHLGNCVIKDKKSIYYGDKPRVRVTKGGEYYEKDGKHLLGQLLQDGYFTRGKEATVSFEIRLLIGKTPEETIPYLVNWFHKTMVVL